MNELSEAILVFKLLYYILFMIWNIIKTCQIIDEKAPSKYKF